jgi:hypothetical protein
MRDQAHVLKNLHKRLKSDFDNFGANKGVGEQKTNIVELRLECLTNP